MARSDSRQRLEPARHGVREVVPVRLNDELRDARKKACRESEPHAAVMDENEECSA